MPTVENSGIAAGGGGAGSEDCVLMIVDLHAFVYIPTHTSTGTLDGIELLHRHWMGIFGYAQTLTSDRDNRLNQRNSVSGPDAPCELHANESISL